MTSQKAIKDSMTEPYNFSPEILREYDIRGQIGKNLSETDAYYVGRSFGTFVVRRGGSRVCVGYDGRETSPIYADAVIRGLTECGLEVEAVGRGPSPMLYFSVKDHMADAGIMITGSHNPPDYNGFKMTLQSAPVYGSLIQEIGKIASEADFEYGEGSCKQTDISRNYIERLLRDLDVNLSGRKIAWDCGNGATGDIVRAIISQMDGKHILLHDAIDGTFPNHHPDPTVDENMQDLIKAVKDNGCDFGIGFDGDGDRIGVVDEKGNILRCDTLMAIYAQDVLENYPGAPIIGDVKCSQVLYDEIARLGGRPIMWKTGHSLIKAKMAEEKAPLAGELSGHIFFNDKWYGFDDAIYCAIRLMNAVLEDDLPLSHKTSHLPVLFNTPEIRFEVKEHEKFELVERILKSIRDQATLDDSIKINDIDGVRVVTDHGWWLLRASNTQNVLVTRAEANSEAALEELKNMVIAEVEKIGYGVVFPEK